jgi:hypothetical protein
MKHPEKSWPALILAVIGLFGLCDKGLGSGPMWITAAAVFICGCCLFVWEVIPEIKDGKEYRRSHPKRTDLRPQKWQPYHDIKNPSDRWN